VNGLGTIRSHGLCIASVAALLGTTATLRWPVALERDATTRLSASPCERCHIRDFPASTALMCNGSHRPLPHQVRQVSRPSTPCQTASFIHQQR